MVRAHLKPSRLLATAFALVHLGAAATVFPLDIHTGIKAVLLAAVFISLVRALRLHALLRARSSIVELEITDCENASIRTRAGPWEAARILCTSCVTPSLTTLNLEIEGSRRARHALLVNDNVHGDDFRKIRVLLRWARPKPRQSQPTAQNPS